jgi:hypothetical protein
MVRSFFGGLVNNNNDLKPHMVAESGNTKKEGIAG